MDLKDQLCQQDIWTNSSSGNKIQKKDPPDQQSFTNFSFQQHQLKWDDPSILDYNTRIESHFPEFKQIFETSSSITRNPSNQTEIPNQQDDQMDQTNDGSRTHEWDPREMLNNLTFLEQKIHQLQNLVHLIVGRRGQIVDPADQLVAQQQQLITADLTSIIVQLISTAGNLLPSVKNSLLSMNSSLGQLGGIVFPSAMVLDGNRVSDQSKTEQNFNFEEHDLKDEEDGDEGENLLPGSYEILQLEREEILAPHTHFCTVCGKGFKRDANLRMHMRGHGDEYKTPAALAKPNKESTSEPMLIKRYSCPYTGCKRNKDHKKFQPLKTILCVKNHYKRTHCDKSYTCSRCNTKKFSVIADLKTHEKHCGKDKWLCSCGTTFSRKDKLFGHIGLFQGHTPAIPLEEAKGSFVGPSDDPSGSGVQNDMDLKGRVDDPTGYFSSLNFDTSTISGFHEFPRPMFDDSEGSFSFLISGSSNHHRKPGGDSGSKDL